MPAGPATWRRPSAVRPDRPAERLLGDPHRAVGRFAQFDGLRGLAAAVVVAHHLLLASEPALADTYRGGLPTRWSAAWWLTRTPLHDFWAGPEAVIVFFVLSGFVLTLPASRQGPSWLGVGYLPRRLVRLYVPVWGALGVAWFWRLVQPRVTVPGASWWLDAHAVPATAGLLLSQASLHDQGNWAYDPVLWSLHWEVLFSVLLPALALATLAVRRREPWAVLAVAAAVVCSGYGRGVGSARLTYLAMFVVGGVLAVQADAVRSLGRRLRPGAAACGAAAALVGLSAPYLALGHEANTDPHGRLVAACAEGAAVAGAITVLVLAAGRPGWYRLLTASPVGWLGSRSFSLYLVHEPVLVSVAFAMGGRMPFWKLAAVAVPLAVVAAELLWRLVERPSTDLSRLIGQRVDDWVRARRALPPGVRAMR